ncbi:MAG: hypothetical protein CMM59_18640 [Rhodospirillaceae bacterium]|nr:hypothetical protein [Rhodospirillaceae bacterium]
MLIRNHRFYDPSCVFPCDLRKAICYSMIKIDVVSPCGFELRGVDRRLPWLNLCSAAAYPVDE